MIFVSKYLNRVANALHRIAMQVWYPVRMEQNQSLGHSRQSRFLKRRCPNCKKLFPPRREWQIFCTSRCRWAAWDASHPRVMQTEPRAT